MPIDRKYIDTLIGQRVRIEHVNGGRHTGVITEGGDNACFTLRKDGMPEGADGYYFNFVDVESVAKVHDLTSRLDLERTLSGGDRTKPVMTYRKRPTTVEAVQWPCDVEILIEWIGPQATFFPPTNDYTGGWDEFTWRLGGGTNAFIDVWNEPDQCWKEIAPGAWIVKGQHDGDFYPCADEVFKVTYDESGPYLWAEPFKEMPGIFTEMEVVDTRHWSRHPLEGQLTPERRQVYTWLQAEETGHQDLKFTEVTKTDGGDLSDDAWTYQPLMDRWYGQIGMYLHRADTLGLTSPLGRQAAAKAVAVAHGMLESIVRVYGDLPPGGVPSGEIDGYVDPMGEEADHG